MNRIQSSVSAVKIVIFETKKPFVTRHRLVKSLVTVPVLMPFVRSKIIKLMEQNVPIRTELIRLVKMECVKMHVKD